MTRTRTLCLALSLGSILTAQDQDWRAFRGTDGTASSPVAVVRVWDDEKNIQWQLDLPGPGTSSPIVVGDSIYITSWSGYGLDLKKPGDPAKLRRHLQRVDRRTGKAMWTKSFAPVPSEDPFGDRMASHGYASSTPISDGKRIYAFFGKSGVFAFDPSGEQLWHTSVGTGSSQWLTGSASSLALWRSLLIVNAADESHAVIGLDKATGKEVWRRESKELDQAHGTPVVTAGEQPVILLALLGEVWALAPQTGKPVWTIKTRTNGSLAPTIVVDDEKLYTFGGQTKVRSHCMRLGGKGDVTETHVQWKSRYGSYVTSPLLFNEHLYWVNEGGIAYCATAKDGELVYKERLQGEFYSSPIKASDYLYYVSRENGTYVLPAKPKFEILAHNKIASDESQFDGMPVACGPHLYLRSRTRLYCIGSSKDGGDK